jgi:hypothetical protein
MILEQQGVQGVVERKSISLAQMAMARDMYHYELRKRRRTAQYYLHTIDRLTCYAWSE